MKRIIVTGATSFVGKALVKELISRGNEVYAVIREGANAEELDVYGAACRVCRCDMAHYADLSSVLPSLEYEGCIHLAWAGTAGQARADWSLQFANVTHSCDLVAALGSLGVPRFIGVGTLAELDVMSYSPEDGSTPNAVSIYGAAKTAAHLATKAVCSDLGVAHVWCRLVNVYGPGNMTGNFVDMASRRFLNGERAAFTEGLQPYDFIFVSDVAAALADAAEKAHANCSYLLGSGTPRPLREFVTIIRDVAAPESDIFFGEIPFNGVALERDAYDAAKLRSHTGFTPQTSFEKGIEQTVDWLKGVM